MKKKVLSVFLSACIFIVSVFCFNGILVNAATTPSDVNTATALSRINTLVNTLSGKYFTTDNTPEYAADADHCKNSNVIQSAWFKNLIMTPDNSLYMPYQWAEFGYANIGWSCFGFACFAQWYIFAQQSSDDVTGTYLTQGSFSKSFVQSNVCPGDIIRVNGHSMIFISSDDSSFTVLDNNWGYLSGENWINDNKIQKHSSDWSWGNGYTCYVSRPSNSKPNSAQQSYYLDVNMNVNGSIDYDFTNVTFDMYINGSRVADDVKDYYTRHPSGTRYEVNDIKVSGCYKYDGTGTDGLSGTVGNRDISVDLKINTSHNWGSWTKLNDTQHQRVCSRDASHVEKANHVWNVGTVTTPPTCTSAGVKTYTCTTCAATKTDPLAALGHSYGSWTKLNDTQHQRVCSRNASHVEIENHSWGTGVVTIPSSCTENGIRTYTCASCSAESTEIIHATGHSWSDWFDFDDAQHQRVCSVDPSHKEIGYHAWSEKTDKPATCTSSGTAILTCTVCNTERIKAIEAPGHYWGEWEKKDDNNHQRFCLRDSSHKQIESHTWNNGFKKKPTCTEEGIFEKTCTVCGSKKTEILKKDNTVHSDRYQNGQTFEFGVYPQSLVKDKETLSSLNKLLSEKQWVSFQYHSGTGDSSSAKPSDYMKYCDIEYNGNKYRAVTMSNYRPSFTYNDFSETNNTSPYLLNTVYWFKFEPLVWEILDSQSGLVVCTSIIDAQPLSVAPLNDYSDAEIFNNSYLSHWLNYEFIDTAFSKAESNQIKKPVIEQDFAYGEKNVCAVTEKKIFILSENEVISYSRTGCDVNIVKDAACPSSDYVLINGGKNSFILRTLSVKFKGILCVLISGDESDRFGLLAGIPVKNSECMVFGVRPAMILNELPKSPASIVEGYDSTCAKAGLSDGTKCVNCGKMIAPQHVLPLLEHNFSEWKTVVVPTVTTEGKAVRICSVCETVETRDIPRINTNSVKVGDVNFDGTVGTADARLCLRRAIGLETYPKGSDEFIACDIDRNQQITTGDARTILRGAIGLEDPETW